MPFRGDDAVRFRNLMIGLASTFNREADKGFMVGYEMALEDLPIEDIASGVGRAIRECEFMPTGARLRSLSGVIAIEDRAAVAWGCLKKAVALHGAYASIEFDDTAITASIRNLGGWERVCEVSSGDEFDKWLRKEFERVYVNFCRNGFGEAMAQPLIGICDRSNSAEGYVAHIAKPKLIETGLKPLPGLPAPVGPRIGGDGQRRLPGPEMKGIE